MKQLSELMSNYPIIPILIKILLTYIGTKILIKYFIKFIDKTVILKSKEKEANYNRFETLGNVAKSIVRYGMYFICAIICLTIIFGPIPLTFAGVGAAIVGFGSQSLIKDIASGFFILFEGQYIIGDHVTIGTNEGIVESIELRVTRIRAFNGDLFIIPNGSIIQVTNHSNGPQRFEVLVSVDHNEDTNKVESILSNCCDNINKENPNILEPAALIGISAFTNTGLTFRILGMAKPLSRIQLESSLRKLIKEQFSKNKIKFASIKDI